MIPGFRVVRGPDWGSGDEDGGEGHVGTLVGVDDLDKSAEVVWDSGTRKTYSAGRGDAFELCVFDNAQSGIRHPNITCDECDEVGIHGIRWKCTVCFDYDLCSSCYHSDKHDAQHEFWRIDTVQSKRFKVARRCESAKVQAKGIFTGAIVCRGQDWQWTDQDGGGGSEGNVLSIGDWDANKSKRSLASVQWANRTTQSYRLGHAGKVDLKLTKAAFGQAYYKLHLPILGNVESTLCKFAMGEKVTCVCKIDILKVFQEKLGRWNEAMTMYNTLAGTIIDVNDTNEVEVQYDDGVKVWYSQDVLTTAEADEIDSAPSLSTSEDDDVENLELGCRVVRGPDWKWGSQDGGEGHVGTIVDIWSRDGSGVPENCAVVLWDSGKTRTYRVGEHEKYDLCVYDNSPIGIKHPSVTCDECQECIAGIRWKCTECFNYDLCSTCYNSDKHDTEHEFWRIDTVCSERVKVSRRCYSEKSQARGIFTGAAVRRGQDWKWNDQDGGEGKEGKVLSIGDWDPNTSMRSLVSVQWSVGTTENYRLGHLGKVDLMYSKSATGGSYYKLHQPILGKPEFTKCKFNIGDKVECSCPIDSLKEFQENKGAWRQEMSSYISSIGTIVAINDAQEVQVQYDDGANVCFHQDVLRGAKADEIDSVSTFSPSEDDDVENLELGCRVVRGPDWKWGNRDGGEGHVGTVVDIWSQDGSKVTENCAVVLWDSGKSGTYRVGKDEKYDLCVYDNATIGIRHPTTTCDGCNHSGIRGIRWKCLDCFDYDLCTACYGSDKHDTRHTFWRIDRASSKRVKLPRRCEGEKLQAQGIFADAGVCRVQDWDEDDQEEAESKEGRVLTIGDWPLQNVSFNSLATVKWSDGTESNCRLGYGGKVDLKFIKSSFGQVYYKDHLPVLGKPEVSECKFDIGDVVSCWCDSATVRRLQENHGGWTEEMSSYTRLTGTVVEIDDDCDVSVQYADGNEWRYNQDVLGLVTPECSHGDPMHSAVVRQALDMDIPKDLVESCVKKRLEENQGEFASIESLMEAVFSMNVTESAPSLKIASSATTTREKLAEEIQKLRDERLCKICMDEDACATFVPCGHLACCLECGLALEVCLICRSRIQSCDTVGGGTIEIQFLHYQDDCSEGFGYCDTLFYFLLGTNSCPSCYASFSPRDSDYFNAHNIDMSSLSSIKGLPNPWTVQVSRFEGSALLNIRVMDEDVGDDDHLTTFYIRLTTSGGKYPTQWIQASDSTVSDGEHYNIQLQYRTYCDSNYYTSTCDTYCVPTNSSSGHYTCNPSNGSKICLTGWKGDSCNVDIDECSEGFCPKGQCVNLPGSALCICDSYHTGHDCSQLINQCDSLPCENDGNCTMHPTEPRHWCTCQTDWTGESCETKIDPCTSQPCLNNGTCFIHPTESRHLCTCPASWTGMNCETKVDPCTSKPCLNNGTCFMHPSESRHLCLCTPDWQGENCETRFDVCSRHICLNGGTCFVHPTQQISICLCTQGWQGPDCDTRINPCISQPCLNGGSCVTEEDFSSFTCECPESFSGSHCQLRHVSADPLIVG